MLETGISHQLVSSEYLGHMSGRGNPAHRFLAYNDCAESLIYVNNPEFLALAEEHFRTESPRRSFWHRIFKSSDQAKA